MNIEIIDKVKIPKTRGANPSSFVLAVLSEVRKLKPHEAIRLNYETQTEAISDMNTVSRYIKRHKLNDIKVTRRRKEIYVYLVE